MIWNFLIQFYVSLKVVLFLYLGTKSNGKKIEKVKVDGKKIIINKQKFSSHCPT